MNFPVVAGTVLVKGGRSICRLARGTVEINCPGEVLFKLLSLCDGQTPMEKIEEALGGWKVSDVRAFVRTLEEQGVLVEANTLSLAMWQYVENPRWSEPEPTVGEVKQLLKESVQSGKKCPGVHYFKVPDFELKALLDDRRSTRSFSGAVVPIAQVLGLLSAAYGVQAERSGQNTNALYRVVPSGGALFPLQIHLVNFKPLPQLDAGVYQVHFAEDGTVGLASIEAIAGDVIRAYADPDLLRHAQGIVIISGSFQRVARKYGNRATLYVPLEAGHAAQNVLLAATGFDLASVEIGGFIEEKLRQLLSLTADVAPLTSIVFGSRQANSVPVASPENYSFRWFEFDSLAVKPAFFLGMVQPISPIDDSDYCWGRDRDPILAHDKAVAEFYDRSACETAQDLILAKFNELPGAIDPRQLVAYTEEQYLRADFPFKPFSEKRVYAWKNGLDYFGGKTVAVLADCVYFHRALPPKLSRKAYTMVSSSGVAAYTDKQGALERALLELIERDAFMRVWLGRDDTPQIALRSLPSHVQQRIRNLNQLGVHVVIKDLTGELVPVVMIFAQHEERGLTTVTAAAAYDVEGAIDHALMEMEAALFVTLGADKPGKMLPQAVRTSADHANLYAQRRYFRYADFLGVSDKRARKFCDIGVGAAKNWETLISRLQQKYGQLVVLDLTPADAALDQGRVPLHVVRAVVPGLIPINFGYGTEPLGLNTVRDMPQQNKSNSIFMPHPFN